jgi:PAS domain S-box-containing protein/putative nucleotidyltransferase with HDIG domain
VNIAKEKIVSKIESAHQEWLCALDAISFPIFLHDKEFRILRCNKAYSQYVGIPYSEIIGRIYYELFPKNDGPLPHCTKALEDPLSEGSEDYIKINDKLFHSKEFIIKEDQGIYLYSLHILEDITEQRQVEQALRESEEKFRSITSSAQDAILMMDNDGKISYWNEAAVKTFGYSENEAIGKHLHTLLAPERFLAAHYKGFEHFKHTGEGAAIGKTLELAALKKDGMEFPIELSLSIAMRNGQQYAIGIIRDITARKKSELSLNRTTRALKTLSAGNIALVRSNDENDLLQTITNIIVEQAGYNLAVVVYAEDNPEKNIIPVAAAGMKEENYTWATEITWDNTQNGQLPVSHAIRSGTTQVCHNIACAIGFKQWKDSALSEGYISNIALPLKNEGKTFGALCIYSSEENAFDDEEIRLLEELANELAYGIINLRTRILHEQHTSLLQQSLEQSIQTIAATVEARDPYTAGHQHRVSELAIAIAEEMNLNTKQIQGIHLASIIHDLGKIHIPAEILSKPGKLSNIEFMIIQTHPQEGYNILKNVKFPWPIADIILQHHEKLDGTGYPQGLKGDEILLEAKIICVADVVEAMSSHRPYRASLGIEPALEEIRRGQGSWYDTAVVDACLKLFDENRFTFSDTQLL